MYLLAIVLSVLRLTASDYLFGIFWPLYCLFFDWRLLITSLISFGHCIVCPSIDGFWLPLWYLLVIVLSVPRLTASDYLFGIFWSMYCLFFDWRLLITSLVSFGHCIVCSSIDGVWLPLWYILVIVLSVPRLTASDYLLGIFKLFLNDVCHDCLMWVVSVSILTFNGTLNILHSIALYQSVFTGTLCLFYCLSPAGCHKLKSASCWRKNVNQY
jgi:uncharacterized membrane protein